MLEKLLGGKNLDIYNNTALKNAMERNDEYLRMQLQNLLGERRQNDIIHSVLSELTDEENKEFLEGLV